MKVIELVVDLIVILIEKMLVICCCSGKAIYICIYIWLETGHEIWIQLVET